MSDEGEDRPAVDWARLGVRFVCGSIPGALAGFGFWVQMCRPPRAHGLWQGLPRLVAAWLGWEATVDSLSIGLIVIALFSLGTGLAVALWPPGLSRENRRGR
jgi:hypothetical protein